VLSLDLLLFHAASTWGMVGLIWTMQLVTYPGFARVGSAEFGAFHEHHCNRIAWVVGPLMGTELVTGLALIWDRPPGLSDASLGVGLGLLAVNWACTAFLSMPLHARLRGHAREAQRALVRTNWLRTVAWSARGFWTMVALRAALAA